MQTGMKSAKDDRRKYTLYAYIPILEGAPPNWTLALVDTPGFGEANVEHVTALTDTLFSTSTAYLYILDSGNMGDAVDAENIRQLYKYDNGETLLRYRSLSRYAFSLSQICSMMVDLLLLLASTIFASPRKAYVEEEKRLSRCSLCSKRLNLSSVVALEYIHLQILPSLFLLSGLS